MVALVIRTFCTESERCVFFFALSSDYWPCSEHGRFGTLVEYVCINIYCFFHADESNRFVSSPTNAAPVVKSRWTTSIGTTTTHSTGVIDDDVVIVFSCTRVRSGTTINLLWKYIYFRWRNQQPECERDAASGHYGYYNLIFSSADNTHHLSFLDLISVSPRQWMKRSILLSQLACVRFDPIRELLLIPETNTFNDNDKWVRTMCFRF